MNPLINRSTRTDVDLGFEFKLDGVTVNGRTINVSDSGMLTRLDAPVELWMVGEIAMTIGPYYVEFEARVARTQGQEYGLSFLLENPNDIRAVRILNDYAVSLATGTPMHSSKTYLAQPAPEAKSP